MTTDTSDGRLTGDRVLAALGRGILGAAYDPAVPERVRELLAMLPSRLERDRVDLALRLLSTRLGALALAGRPTPVPGLPPAGAEAVVRRWATSRLPARRQLAQALLTAVLHACYAHPGAGRDRTGYPGPLGPPPDVPRRLAPLAIGEDTKLDCDVVVVGSGAGGGTVAGELARAGASVVVLERGAYHAEADFTHEEHEATADLYLYGLTISTTDLGCRILAGSTLGGGTVVNYTTSLRPPKQLLDEWAASSGLDLFTSGELEPSLDAVAARIGAGDRESRPGRRDALMEKGLRALGWHAGTLPRDVRGCSQDDACGYCGFGCRLGAKQSTMRTYLEDAEAHGARLVVGADANRVLVQDGRATGVVARAGRHRLLVRARAVVVAAGAVETPALLLRSGLGGQVGRHLRLHPGAATFGAFDEPVQMWTGTTQARYSGELRERLGDYGPLLETIPVHPGTGSAALPWRGAAEHAQLMDRFGNLSMIGVLGRDEAGGRVRLDRDGNVRVRYRITPRDEQRLVEGVIAGGRVLAAAGATEVWSQHPQWLAFHPGDAAGEARWGESVRRAGYRGGRVTLFSFHQMGSCRMGADPSTSAVDGDHQTHEVRGLFVADSSVFPTASGVNPMLTIMGLAHHAAARIAARVG